MNSTTAETSSEASGHDPEPLSSSELRRLEEELSFSRDASHLHWQPKAPPGVSAIVKEVNSVTSKKSPNVYKSCQNMVQLENFKILQICVRLWPTVVALQKIENILFYRTAPVCHTCTCQMQFMWMSLILQSLCTQLGRWWSPDSLDITKLFCLKKLFVSF